MLVPLGVAATRDEDDAVWLATDDLRIETPPGWSDEERRYLVSEIVGSTPDDITFPPAKNVSLRTVSEPFDTASGEISLDRPVDEILEVARGREIEGFDGDALVFSG